MRTFDLFAGPGGWDQGVRPLGIEPLGIEIDEQACLTRAAAGHQTLRQDVSLLDPRELGPCDLLIASPPCPAFSIAGQGRGRANADVILDLAASISSGEERRAEFAARIDDASAALVVEPLRYALALRPTWIAFEQVPPALPLWERFAEHLAAAGYATWTGKLSSEEFGVPQVRKRALLLASLEGDVQAPRPTHVAYRKGDTQEATDGLLPWVSMADALGWGATRPYATLAGGTQGGPCYDFLGGSGSRRAMLAERSDGRWLNPGLTSSQPNRRLYSENEPAPTIAFGHDMANWKWQTATEGPIRMTFAEAGVLQGFPADYPWSGTRTSKAVQIGNAVPPPLAHAVVEALIGAAAVERQAA